MRTIVAALIGVAVVATGCGSSPPATPAPLATVAAECHINPPELCGQVVVAARRVTGLNGARLVIVIGRGLAFHAEVHACFPDGRYVVVDVIGEDLQASVRPDGWEDPPCR